jgi:cation diffusion facilitator CzcD-associated flavoprotein CzcO
MPGLLKEWLIIGGGIHGTYFANLFIRRTGVPPEKIAIVDPHERLLAAWHRMTANCGMRFLRSPATHQIDLPVLSLYRFAKTPAGRSLAAFIPPYNRPSLALFNEHSARVIAAGDLAARHIVARALALRRDGPVQVVETTGEVLRTRRILLAIGLSEQPCWPGWARALRRRGAAVAHVFDPDFDRETFAAEGPTLVVGGGLTAVQTALALAAAPGAHVTLVTRRALQESQFDFDPCWIGPKCLRGFYRQDYATRRAAIDDARMAGSLPGEVLQAFKRAHAERQLAFRKTSVRGGVRDGKGIRLDTAQGELYARRVVLATGFHPTRPGGQLIDRLVTDWGLPCNPCGYPIVGADLQWGPNLYVTGPLAELQIGPCARNIVGARNAGRQLLAAFG